MAQQKVYQMSRLARGQSERWIRQQYNTAIKAANDRIKTVSKEKYRGAAQAYEYYVKGDLEGAPYVKQRGGMTVFKALPRGASREQSLEALRMVERFLGAKTSTVAGIKEVERYRENLLQQMLNDDYRTRGGEESSAPRLTRAEADNILRWMGTQEGKDAKADYDSNQVREAVTKAVIASRGKKKVSHDAGDLYAAFLKREQSLADWIEESEEHIAGYAEF